MLSKEDFKSHLENCSSSVQCQICGLLVKTKSMNKHIQSKHENIRKHQCHRCPYAAKTFRRLKTHLLSHDSKYTLASYFRSTLNSGVSDINNLKCQINFTYIFHFLTVSSPICMK